MTTSTYQVTGLTCGHCVSAVSGELKSIAGVTEVTVELDPAGASAVTVVSEQQLPIEQVSTALDEAGDYRLVDA